jgi:hypothetical protein
MRTKLTTLLTVIGAVTVLVLAANTVAMATTGKALLAGKINKSAKLTSITRTTPGTGLQVRTKSAANAPLAVNGKGKVTNLNADTVDGFDSSRLGTRILSWTYTGTSTSIRTFTLSGLPLGKYLISYEVYMPTNAITDGTTANCYLLTVPTLTDLRYAAETAVTTTGFGAPLAATGLVTKNADDEVFLTCRLDDAGSWTATASHPVRITAQPILGTTNKGTPSTIRTAAK